MSLITPPNFFPLSKQPKIATAKVNSYYRVGFLITAVSLATLLSGCSTTHEFKPTASVMVGAHKSL